MFHGNISHKNMSQITVIAPITSISFRFPFRNVLTAYSSPFHRPTENPEPVSLLTLHTINRTPHPPDSIILWNSRLFKYLRISIILHTCANASWPSPNQKWKAKSVLGLHSLLSSQGSLILGLGWKSQSTQASWLKKIPIFILRKEEDV